MLKELVIGGISRPSLDAEGAQLVGDALKVNSSITSITLINNNVGDEGAR